MTNAYCRVCKKVTEQVNPEIKTTKKGMKYSVGLCAVCGKKKNCVMLKKV